VALLKLCLHCGRMYQPWSRNNRGRCRDCLRKYESTKRARRANRTRSSMAWQNARAAARKRDGERCRQCGSIDKLEVHHIKSLAEGGAEFDLSNLVTLCQECHVDAGGRGQGGRERRTAHTRKPVRGETHTHSETENNFRPDNDVEPLVG
jgi:5-methylcytosine-specific restriction endonuclease McrA